ncbi:MAG: efflux RND transporter periplasmic adaptor subunit [Planctomycetes bacterium]|nr:efflux RND transporter periplasmic adaptor subunit [Planctomycetota bacterium]
MALPRREFIVALLAVLCLCPFVEGATRLSVMPSQVVRAITRPSGDVTLSFVLAGRLSMMPFKDGDALQAEQIVAYLDDRAERARLAQTKAQSENLTQIMASEASLAQKKVDLKKLTKAAQLLAATELEVEHAQLDVRIAELSLVLARFEHDQAVRQWHESQIRIDQMQLRTPISGIVAQSHVEEGESVNGLEEVMRVVQTDPLWIDVSIPITQAALIKPGAWLDVTFYPPDPNTVRGRVIFVAPVADAASNTLTVRLEVPNPGKRPAGEHVQVRCEAIRLEE